MRVCGVTVDTGTLVGLKIKPGHAIGVGVGTLVVFGGHDRVPKRSEQANRQLAFANRGIAEQDPRDDVLRSDPQQSFPPSARELACRLRLHRNPLVELGFQVLFNRFSHVSEGEPIQVRQRRCNSLVAINRRQGRQMTVHARISGDQIVDKEGVDVLPLLLAAARALLLATGITTIIALIAIIAAAAAMAAIVTLAGFAGQPGRRAAWGAVAAASTLVFL
jgi:hypothetical protein